MANSGRDENRTTTIIVQSSVTAATNLNLTATPISGVNPLNVAIVDASGVQVTAFGASTIDGATFTQNTSTGGVSMGVYVASPQTLTTGKSGAIAVDINRNTIVAPSGVIAAAVPANAFYQGISDGTNLRGVLGAANSLNSTGAGLPTAQLVAQLDDTSPSSVTENQFANLRMNSARQLYAQTVNIDTFTTSASFTITLASLASSTVGVGRQSTLLTGNTSRSALVTVKWTAGTSPTANTLVYVYLLRSDGTITDDNAGASDAGITIVNAPLLGTILVSAATSNATYYGVFDTKFLGSLGITWGVALVNSSGATANATGGNFDIRYTLIT